MTSSTLITTYLGEGLAANRPSAPLVPAGGIGIWYSTDTKVTSIYDPSTTAWVNLAGVGANTQYAPQAGGNPVPALSSFTQRNFNPSAGSTSTVENSGIAFSITDTSGDNQLVGLSKAVPSTPYLVAIAIGFSAVPAQYAGFFFGWTDGTKAEVYGINCNSESSSGDPPDWQHTTWSAFNTRASASAVLDNAPIPPFRMWLGLADDGTNVNWKFGQNGIKFMSVSGQVTKSTGYLGSAGYSNIFFGVNPYVNQSQDATITLDVYCYDVGGASRGSTLLLPN